MSNNAIPQIDWNDIHKTERDATEADTTNQPTEPQPTGRKPSKPYLTFPHGVTKSAIINALAVMPMSLAALMADTGRGRNATWRQLTAMLQAGVVVKLAKGFYALGPGGIDAAIKASHLDSKPNRKTALIVIV